MTSLSAVYAILQSQISDAFAELACRSSTQANDLLARFPGYGAAKFDLSNIFWHADANRMLVAIQAAPVAICDKSAPMD